MLYFKFTIFENVILLLANMQHVSYFKILHVNLMTLIVIREDSLFYFLQVLWFCILKITIVPQSKRGLQNLE